MVDYTERFADAARSFGLEHPLFSRLMEESGVRDVWDELANFNDGLSVTEFLRNIGSTVYQAGTVPLNTASYLSIEADRAAGAAGLSAWGAVTGQPDKVREPWTNYRTAWTPPTESEDPARQTEGALVAPGVYHAAAFSDLLIVSSDRAQQVNVFLPLLVSSTGGMANKVGTIGKPAGPYANGSYVGPAFDIYSPTAADDIRDSYLRTAQTISAVSTQAVIDPLNWLAGPIGASISGLSAKKVIALGGEAHTVGTDAADLVARGFRNRVYLRNAQRPAGFGHISQRGLAELLSSPEGMKVAKWMAEEKNPTAIADWLRRTKAVDGTPLAFGDEAGAMGDILAHVNNPEDVFHALNSFAFRNVESTNRLNEIVLTDTRLDGSLGTLLGTKDNLFDQALVDWRIGDQLPADHILNMEAKNFLDNAIAMNPTIQKRWDALADEERAKVVTDFGEAAKARTEAIRTMQNVYAPGRQDQLLMAFPTARKIKRMGFDDVDETGALIGRPKAAREDWLAYGKTSAVHLPGGSHRFAPRFLLLSRPGLTFKLHGLDAIDKFDDMIKYANSLIGSTLKNADGTPYQFALDPETQNIRAAFIDAGTQTSSPEQLRAAIVNRLQGHVLAKIAEDGGFDTEVAKMLAEAGMVRADNLNSALLSADKGYTSVVNDENGVITVIATHPTTAQQAANFVPIMDWAGVRKAITSRPMQALTDPENLVSVATAEKKMVKASDPEFRALLERYPVEKRLDLRKFGRVETFTGAVYHGLVDLSDTVRQLFTHSVLLRLGYPVRNLAEGTLSTTGSGVGLLNVMSKMDLPMLFANHLSNGPFGTMFPRMIDRYKSFHGIINNEEALKATLLQINKNIQMSTSSVRQMLYLVADETTNTELARIAATSKDAEVAAAAQRNLEYLSELKLRLAQGIDPEFVVTDEMKELTGVAQRLYYTDLNNGLGHTQDAMDPKAYALDQELDRPLSTVPEHTVAQLNVDAAYNAQMFGKTVAGQPQWSTRVFSGEKDSAQVQWAEAKARMVELRKTHDIQYRASADDPWTPYGGGKKGEYQPYQTKYVEGVHDKWEFRAIPKEGSAPRVLAVDTWGKEVDFRTEAGLESLLNAGINDWDGDILHAAIGGDRAAQERMSDILASHGIYRAVFPDSDEWGGIQVLVHPKGVGNRGLFHAVDEDVRQRVLSQTAEKVQKDVARGATPGVPTPSRVGNQRKRGQPLGAPVDPTHFTKLPDILKNGGFEKIMDDQIAERVQLMRQKAAVQMALDARMAKVAKVSKKRGARTPNMHTYSRYSPTGQHINANVLAGHHGYAYANYASADETTSLTISGNLYRQDLLNDLRRSFMQPTDVLPTDPQYWEGFSNLMGRMYSDLPGAEDMAKLGVATDYIDPVVKMALQNGDRERLYEDAVAWALHTPEGQDWVKTLDLFTPPSGTVDEAIALADQAQAMRGTPKGRGWKARQNQMERQGWGEGQSGHIFSTDVQVADVIRAHFNFADNYMLDNPVVRDLFLEGKATAENLRKAYEANPWELKPFNGMLSPTSAEYKQAQLAKYAERGTSRELTDKILNSMSTALRAIGSQPETRMLRHPVFTAVAETDFQQRVTHAENSLGRALSLTEQADLRNRSQAFALTKIKDTLYTLESRSTLDDYLRFVAPFFPAWVNAASRWGKFYMRNPANPGKIASRVTSISTNTLLVDENGEPTEANGTAAFDSYLVVPFGAGNLPVPKLKELVNKMWPGAAEVMNSTYIPLRSIDVIFQGQPLNPGFGPWVTVPTQWLLNKRDDWYQNEMGKWIIDQIMPVGPTASGIPAMDYAQHFLPTGVRRIIDLTIKDKAWYAEYSKNKLMLISMAAEGTYTEGPEQMEEDAIELTKFSSMMKIMSAFGSPVAAQQRGEPEFYASQWRQFRDQTGSADEADKMFYERYPAQWVLSQGKTSNLTGGMASGNTTTNQRDNGELARMAAELNAPELMGFADNYQPDGELAAYTTKDYNPYSRRWQLYNSPQGFMENYRASKSVDEVAREAAVDEGWMKYQQVEAAMSGRLVAQGYRVGTYEYQKALSTRMTAAGTAIAKDYPDWGLDRGQVNTSKNERNAVFFRAQINDEKWMAGKEDHLVTQSIREYLNARDLARAGMEKQGLAKSSSAKANRDWNAALMVKREQLSARSPAFKEWVDRYFRNDIVGVDDITYEDYMEATA